MITILTTLDLPRGWLWAYAVKDEAEALKIADGRKAYFYKSRIIEACYLYIPAEIE